MSSGQRRSQLRKQGALRPGNGSMTTNNGGLHVSAFISLPSQSQSTGDIPWPRFFCCTRKRWQGEGDEEEGNKTICHLSPVPSYQDPLLPQSPSMQSSADEGQRVGGSSLAQILLFTLYGFLDAQKHGGEPLVQARDRIILLHRFSVVVNVLFFMSIQQFFNQFALPGI